MKSKNFSQRTGKYEIDMCNGPLLGKILLFALPLILSGNLQLLFNAADTIVVGRFAGSEALAAVGSTGPVTNLLVNIFIGLSVGTNVLAAKYIGSGQKKQLEEVVHTSVAASLISGIILAVIGILVAEPALKMMSTPENVIDQAVVYMKIYFAGIPVIMLYNFGSAILRAVGDTRRPLYYLTAAGIINVVLNLIFVVCFQMDVAGVALATVISQAVAAFLVVQCLRKEETDYRLSLNKLRLHPEILKKMIQIGLPAGVNSSLFSISNILIQSSINSFGSVVMAANAASQNLEGFVSASMNSLYQTAISFSGQNYGARKYRRIWKVHNINQVLCFLIGVLVGAIFLYFHDFLLRLYTTEEAVVEYGFLRLSIICSTYFLCGMMNVVVGTLRGMGYAMVPMLVSITGVCVFRVVWLATIYKAFPTLECLYISYPISWGITLLVNFICFVVLYKRIIKKEKSVEE